MLGIDDILDSSEFEDFCEYMELDCDVTGTRLIINLPLNCGHIVYGYTDEWESFDSFIEDVLDSIDEIRKTVSKVYDKVSGYFEDWENR